MKGFECTDPDCPDCCALPVDPQMFAESMVVGAIESARAKWGSASVAGMAADGEDRECLAVLVEEVGEVARAINEEDFVNLAEELAQVAAVALMWLEGMVARGHIGVAE